MPRFDIPISYTSGKHMANRISTLFLSFLSEVIVSHHVKQGKIPYSIPIIYGIVGDFKGESFDTMFFKFIIGKYTGNIFLIRSVMACFKYM